MGHTTARTTSEARAPRRWALAALVLLAAGLLAACGGREAATGAGGSAAEAEGAVASQLVSAPAQPADHTDHADHSDHADHAGRSDHADHGAHAHHPEPLAAAPLPGTSIYHLATPFTDHRGAPLALDALRGQPAVFVMFYGDCTTACPLLVRAAEEIEAALPADLAATTRFVMVSFDTERDTPERLGAYAQEKGLDRANWHWLVGSPLQTRQLATLLGVQYRDAGNGMFAHSNVVTVLDADGVPIARLEGLGVKLEPAIEAVRTAAKATR